MMSSHPKADSSTAIEIAESSPQVPIIEPNELWLLKTRHEGLNDMFSAVWDNYIKFYTVFLTFSLGAMGWLITHTSPIPTRDRKVIASALILQSALTAITSAAIGMYSKTISLEQAELATAIADRRESAPAALRPTLPKALALWAGIANTVAMIGMIGAWVYFGFCAK